ncbi:MAG: AMP-binding protein [Rhodospirillaceae bacterium]|nr:AMP-binding protein [Rhodospirillaceae bacterium]
MKLTPAHLGLLAELHPIAKQSTGSRKFVVGGEALTKSTTTPWRKAAPSVAIFNEYGPTETVVGCTAFKLGNSAPDGRSEPIGKAIWNTQLYVLDRKLAPIPAGMVGELYIGGAGVSWGYWRQAGLTADRFIADPFTDHPGSRMYRTGDLVRLGADGNLEYLGRNDNQLKVSGYRIEPGEIEARLQAVDGVSGAAVVAMSGGGDQRLVAFYTGAATVEACNAALTSRLPPYMVPDRFVLRDSLPLTANDKVDRGALASLDIAAIIMDGRPGVALDQSIARESGEEELADPEKLEALITIWRNVLQEEDAGADTDFFAAGGTSLGAIRLIARLKRHFGQTIEYADLALSPTPQGLALTMFPAQPAAPADLPLVLDLYRTILDTPEMDGDTDFFEAGGTSLNAIRLVARLRRGLGQEVPADIVHGGRTARGVAALIAQGNCAAGTAPGSTVDLGPQLQLQTDEAPQASPGEQQLWLENELGGQATAYVMQAAIKLKLPNAEEALGAAFGMLAERHPVLRTAYTSGDTGSEVEILSAGVPTITNRTVGRYETLDDLVRATAQGDAALSFRIDRGKTSRLSFVETADGDGVLILSLHHIVSDNTSLGLILGDLIALLTSGTLGDAPKANYRAYAQWRERRMQATADGQIAYWQRRLAVPPSPLAVPLDRPRTRDHSPVGGSVPFRIDKTLTNAAASLARRNGGSIQNVLVAAYTIFLHRLTGAGDLIFGIPVSDRPEGFDDVAGYFLNTLPLRVKIAGGETGEMLLQQIRDTMAELLSHADQPLARIVEATNPERFEGRTPLLQTVLDWREGNPQLDDLVADEQPQPEAYPLDVATAPFDLALSLSGQEDGTITGGFIFDYASLDSETVAAWTRSFVMILEGLVQQSDCPIRRLPTVAAQDLDRASLAGPKVDAPPELSLLLLRALAEYDSLPAVESGDVTLTYGDLRARAQDIIPGPGKVSIIDTDDPVERVVQALAAILGQKVLALFDPALPQARRDKMRSTLLAIETEGIDGTVASYVQFTSGTTGEPKAALLSRVGLANLIRTLGNDLSIKPGSRVLQLAAPAFDAWVWEVFITLGAGGTLVLADRSALHAGEPLAVCLRERAVSHVTITPSALAALGQVDLPELTTIVAAGEPLSADLMETWAPGRRMFNAYGPCEATVCASHGVCAAGSDTPDIGTPIVGMTAMVMDRYAMPAIPGAVGELWVGGIGVGLGYVGAPAITAERFIADPGADDGRRLYCTGDMARIRTNVRIQFIGRDDRQVKVRGVRMELDEIEAALQAVAGVRQAAAKTVPDATGRPALAAWVTGPAHDEAASIREALAIHLPETMLPAFLTVLDHMPVTATGKIDRLALSDPRKAAAHPDQAIAAGEPSAGAEPCSELEAVILDVFADILALPARPGRDQNFFVLGGHSLLVVRLAAALSGKLDRKVPLPAVFANPTAAGLAGLFTSGETQNACVIRTLRHGTGPAAFLFHAVDGSGHCYDQLAGNWHGDRHINVVEQGQGFDSLETLAEGYAQAIDTAAGDGDTVLLGGWSLGATIAAAVAEQLRRQGRDVRVVLIDAARPVPHENEHSADETEIAAAAKAAGADGATVDRVRENIRIAANHSFGRIPGPAAVIRASDTPREGAAPDLGWAGVFDSTAVKTMPGSHHTILRSGDLPALSRQIERLWDEQEA